MPRGLEEDKVSSGGAGRRACRRRAEPDGRRRAPTTGQTCDAAGGKTTERGKRGAILKTLTSQREVEQHRRARRSTRGGRGLLRHRSSKQARETRWERAGPWRGEAQPERHQQSESVADLRPYHRRLTRGQIQLRKTEVRRKRRPE